MNDVAPLRGGVAEAARPGLRGSTAVIVAGMHRSGTSALAGMLSRLGIAFGEHLMPASPDNPRGYWEHLDVVAAHQRLMSSIGYGWNDIRPLPPGLAGSEAGLEARRALAAVLTRDFAGRAVWGVKDPRLCRVMPLWLALLDELDAAPAVVIAVRHPGEVAASLAARDGMRTERALLLWLRHVLEAERATRGLPRSVVDYKDLVGGAGWRFVKARIECELGIAWPNDGEAVEKAVDDFLSAELRHNRAVETGGERRVYGPSAGWVDAVYAAMANGGDIVGVCDAVGAELARAEQLLLPLICENRSGGEAGRTIVALTERLAKSEHQATELRALALRQASELNAFRRRLPAGDITIPPDADAAYPRWIANRASTALAHPQWRDERKASWPAIPKLALGMLVPAGTAARVVATVQSLRAQDAGEWELYVAADEDVPEILAGEPWLRWGRAEGNGVTLLNQHFVRSAAQWVALIDAGDQLAPHALFCLADAMFRHPEWEAVYSDEDRVDPQGIRSAPHFKPDFNLELLRTLPYIGGLLAVRREVFAAIGGFDPLRDGTEEYDLALRLAERLGPAGIGHIADVLYHRLTISGRSKRSVAEICADMPRIVQAHLDRMGVAATAEPGTQPQFCRVRYQHEGPEPLVSIIVPTRDQLPLLKRCIETVLRVTRYENYELIVVDNGSTDRDACAYLQAIEDKFAEIGSRIRVLRYPGPFNFSQMNNRAVREGARGEYVCLLNNDAAPLDGEWLAEMMSFARRPDVGVVGAKLFYADGRIQHAGVILGIGDGTPADHPYNGDPGNSFGYWGRAQAAQELSAVTAACMVVRRSVYEELGGFDETDFAVCFNDVDFSLRVGEMGYRIVWTPFARLLHDGSASLRSRVECKSAEEKQARFLRELDAMFNRWLPRIALDPAYNRNLSPMGNGFSIETEGPPTWDPELRPRQRIIAYAADREGCGEYRIIAPSRVLLQSGRVHCCETMRLMTPPEMARIDADSVVLQRQLEWHQIRFIERLKSFSRARRIFEIDDLITSLPPKNVHRKSIAPDIASRLKKALSLCDRLVVSTEPLARAYGRWCDETVVLPNRLERTRWSGLAAKRRGGGKPRVGWAGAVGHTGDLAVIASVVEATAKEVDWVFFGMCLDGLRRFVAEVHDWVPLHSYAEKLASLDLDLAVAPLEHHPFNDAKSNLRLLEYGILGYPVICSDIVPYQCGLPVQRVANRHAAWTKAIRDMAADRDACRRAGEQLRAAVVEGWMLDDHLDEWIAAWLPQ